MKYERKVNLNKVEESQLQSLFQQVSGTLQPAHNIHRVLDSDSSALFVIQDETKILGAAIVNICQKAAYAEARIDNVVIDESSRGQGLSRILMTALIQWATEQGVTSIELTSNPRRVVARQLYESLGFSKRDTDVLSMKI